MQQLLGNLNEIASGKPGAIHTPEPRLIADTHDGIYEAVSLGLELVLSGVTERTAQTPYKDLQLMKSRQVLKK